MGIVILSYLEADIATWDICIKVDIDEACFVAPVTENNISRASICSTEWIWNLWPHKHISESISINITSSTKTINTIPSDCTDYLSFNQ